MRRSPRLGCTLALIAISTSLCAQEADYVPLPEGTINFAEHIAPIIRANCVRCHDGGITAPFELTDYPSVRARGRALGEITRQGRMPPALAEPDYGPIANSGRLTTHEIGLIGQWLKEGSPAGDEALVQPPPTTPRGWKLGPPDLVLQIEEPFVVPADAFGLSRNFVLPLQLDSDRWVRAYSLKRHSDTYLRATLYVDPSGSTANLDPEDLDGVVVGAPELRLAPHPAYGGQLLVTRPWPMPEGVSQKLTAGTSIVLQLHFQATGVEEEVQPEIGLYFAEEPATQTLVTLSLGSQALDIPAGEAEHRVESSFRLPVAAKAVGVLPNAHFLGHELKGWATLPDGSEVGLVWIKEWDYNHQKQYWFTEPIELPAGTVIAMDFVYDNSADNFNNPNYPPEAMSWGLSLQNEVAGLNVQLLVDDADLDELNQAYSTYLAE